MATTKKNVVDIKPDVNAQIETLRADLAALTQTLKTQAKSTAQAKKSEVVDVASAKVADTKAKYNELTNTAEKSIRENPLSSVAIAVAAGMFLGLLTRR
jgi:ElaB/YqjD/DUF883 family membrane-anchored ribosome-binding protein